MAIPVLVRQHLYTESAPETMLLYNSADFIEWNKFQQILA